MGDCLPLRTLGDRVCMTHFQRWPLLQTKCSAESRGNQNVAQEAICPKPQLRIGQAADAQAQPLKYGQLWYGVSSIAECF
jgi:hypothetical protein